MPEYVLGQLFRAIGLLGMMVVISLLIGEYLITLLHGTAATMNLFGIFIVGNLGFWGLGSTLYFILYSPLKEILRYGR